MKLEQSVSRFQRCVYFVEINIGKRHFINQELPISLREAVASEFSPQSFCEIDMPPKLFGAPDTARPAEYHDQFLLKTNCPVPRDGRGRAHGGRSDRR
jgi:hypothetical protein